ncbi:hypothetical protein PAXRUDRAFT_22495 [Paxillus rubicundulus Ve08.2h10]|uniref:Uncharacterized protein n=1 Tax=Paxillus rubicundulus Ve08.2h10 TaxID=930991 RepID=A0A0D0BK24_9AGAM|nr:hypothetical protein PAXRUDRAFT_22495 [Paxillus rubicundulus Ve08.2h10]
MNSDSLEVWKKNRFVEWMTQMLSLLANAMLKEFQLPKSFWADTMAKATYITAQSPTSMLHGASPY